MSDWIGLGLILLILLGGVFGLAHLGTPRKMISQEEFEKRVKENPGILSAGVMGIQKILEPGVKNAVEVQQDLRQGRYQDAQRSGEGDKTINDSQSAANVLRPLKDENKPDA